MRGETWVVAAFLLIGTIVAISQCYQWNNRNHPGLVASPETTAANAETAADTLWDSESQGLKRQWDRVDALCLLDQDELVRARNCALRQQFERELARKNLCRTSESWGRCPQMKN
ncbi:hypothetical protein [Brevundimonas sp.]|uniref:hypothetical protein n=1 Tax=Brevundimonas sp. TaxID=1871086 RepID=UPI002FDA52AD